MKLLLLALLLTTTPGQTAGPDSLKVAPDFHTPAPSSPLQYSFGDYLLHDSAPNAGYLTVSLDPRGPQCYTPTNRFNAMLGGAGAATSMAMFFGAVGTTLGWFSENTSWAITGAMATAGALWAGTHYQPQQNLQFNWNGDSVIPGYATPGSH
ncbi:MAG TPA: hypothetical protein VJS69_03850 [Candidatus Krumholzibacteria bacterium]|nr:hypothetical protein [Candidatus Krumholzibacteria bacterium]